MTTSRQDDGVSTLRDGESTLGPEEPLATLLLSRRTSARTGVRSLDTTSPFEQLHGNRRQHDKHAVRAKNAIGRQHMDVRVECQQIAEGLNEQDQSRPTLHPGAGVGSDRQSLHDMAQLPEQSALAGENRSQHPRYGEDVLPMRHRS